jgi:hypothetical protein
MFGDRPQARVLEDMCGLVGEARVPMPDATKWLEDLAETEPMQLKDLKRTGVKRIDPALFRDFTSLQSSLARRPGSQLSSDRCGRTRRPTALLRLRAFRAELSSRWNGCARLYEMRAMRGRLPFCTMPQARGQML